MIVGEAPGPSEVRSGEPFAGSSGHELSNMLHEAGILRTECYITNVVKTQPFANKVENLYDKLTPKACIPGSILIEGIKELWEEIERINPHIIIPLGNTALYAVTGERSISKWRGSIMASKPALPSITQTRDFKVVPTYHPSAIMRMWSWRHIAVQDLRRCAREAEFPEIRTPNYSFLIRPSFAEATAYLDGLAARLAQGVVKISCDIETLARQISCIGFATSRLEAICIPILSKDNKEGYWSAEEEFAIVKRIRHILSHPNARVFGQNFLYDTQYLVRYWGVKPNHTDDTMVAWHTLFPGEKKSLDFISSMLCEHYVYWKDELKDYKAYPADEELFWLYNCKDVVYTYEDMESLESALEQVGLREQYQFLMDLHEPVLSMMLRGTKFDVAQKQVLSLELWDTMIQYEERFNTMFPHNGISPKSKSPWWNSPQQLKKLLYEQCGLPVQRNKKTKRPSTDDDSLEALKTKQPLLRPLFQAIQEYRSLGVFKNNFLDTPIEKDGRIRCSFGICGTETFRFSSSSDAFGYGTNLQNISKGNE
jgi:DNA polymerase